VHFLGSTDKHIFLIVILEVYSHRVNLLNFLFRVLLLLWVFKYPAFFHPSKETQFGQALLDLLCLSLLFPVVFIDLYFLCQKSSHRFLLIFFSVTEDNVLIEIMK